MKTILALILLLPSICFAEFKYVEAMGIHLFSRHDPYKGENQYNPGLYVRFKHGIQAGYYTNSIAKQTNYVGWTSPDWYRLRISLIAATGYREKQPVIAPIPSVKLYQFDDGPAVWLAGTPVQITDSRAVGHLFVEWELK